MKRKLLNYILVLFLFFGINLHLTAKHIVGGDMTYECVGINSTFNQVTFKIRFTVYRDTQGGGADFDNPAEIGIYRENNGIYRYVESFNQSLIRRIPLDPDTGIPCLAAPTNIGVERADYEFEVTLDISTTDSYIISYRRCCRNNTIFNIIDPQDQGATYSVTITPEAQVVCDNSPIFNNFPPLVICAGKDINFDHSARDLDSVDSTVYEFCSPYVGGGTYGSNAGENGRACNGVIPDPVDCIPEFNTVTFKPPFSADVPMGGSPTIEINRLTGLITGVPEITGQFVVGICAKSYRNGQLIAEIVRDFQFNVAVCEPLITAAIDYDELIGGSQFRVVSCGDRTLTIKNTSSLETFIESYDWIFPINETDTLTFIERDIVVSFPDTGSYMGQLIINRDGLFPECRDTADISVLIYPDINSDFTDDFEQCLIKPINFIDASIADVGQVEAWEWTINNILVGTDSNLTYEFSEAGNKNIQLKVTDKNNCSDVKDTILQYYPLPISFDIAPNKVVGCAPEKITFDNLTAFINEDYDITWDFGELGISKDISPTIIYDVPGIYTVGVKVVSPINCELEKQFSDYIRIQEGPHAQFSYNPNNVSILDNIVTFTDESSLAEEWIWNIGGDVVFDKDHTYIFRDTGYVEVLEIVKHANGCTDTAFALIDISPVPTYFMPNAFTPNNDGLNDVYLGKGYTDGFKSFVMQIYDRWGARVYETTDPLVGWNGKIDNGDKRCPAGTYVYKVNYIGPRNEKRELRGHLTMLR